MGTNRAGGLGRRRAGVRVGRGGLWAQRSVLVRRQGWKIEHKHITSITKGLMRRRSEVNKTDERVVISSEMMNAGMCVGLIDCWGLTPYRREQAYLGKQV